MKKEKDNELNNIFTDEFSDYNYSDDFLDNDLNDYIKDEFKIPDTNKKTQNLVSASVGDEPKKKSGVKITSVHKGHRERVLNKFIKHGISCFTDYEVLEFLLFFSIPYKDTNVIAHRLIEKFGSIKAVMEADHFSLCSVDGIGERTAALITLLRELYTYISTTQYTNDVLYTSKISAKFCMDYFKNHVNESFIVISLNSERRVKCVDVISVGNETETAFYPRDVVKAIVKNRATSVILSHNHPDNNPEPSMNDIILTEQITTLLRGLGTDIIDHIICAGDSYVSFSDRGML